MSPQMHRRSLLVVDIGAFSEAAVNILGHVSMGSCVGAFLSSKTIRVLLNSVGSCEIPPLTV